MFNQAAELFQSIPKHALARDFEREARALYRCATEGPFQADKESDFYESAYWQRVTEELGEEDLQQRARDEYVRVVFHYLGWLGVAPSQDPAPVSFWIDLRKEKP